jgi:hypothetical protein
VLKGGAELIADERRRQVNVEGWTPEHDDEHHGHEIAAAAVCYVEASYGGVEVESPWDWPWHPDWWKPSDDPIRNLVKAGALIAAEIDRIQRTQQGEPRIVGRDVHEREPGM